MKKSSSITGVESKVSLPVTMVEEHVNSLFHPENSFRETMKSGQNSFSLDYENISWCCEELPVTGTVEISFSTGRTNIEKYISIPVTANFCVVCTRGNSLNYKLTWSCSLS